MASVAMEMLGAVNGKPEQTFPEELRQRIAGILAGSGDAIEAVNVTRNLSSAYIRETAARDAGAVYTPLPVARYMCRRAIENYLSGHLIGVPEGIQVSIDGLIDCGERKELRRVQDLLQDVRFADTSCGTGIFLEAALEELCNLRFVISRRLDKQPRAKHELAAEIIANNIYGTDIEAYSMESARVRLLLRLASYGVPEYTAIDGIKMNLSQGNVLLPEKDSAVPRPFDIIAGNPPYMRVKSMFGDADPGSRKQMKDSFARAVKASGLYECQEGNLNLYKLFIERNLSLLRDQGSMCLIFPSSFLNETTSARLRQRLFSCCNVEEIVEIPERSKLFDSVNQATCIMTCRKGTPTNT